MAAITAGGNERYDSPYLYDDLAREWFQSTPEGPAVLDLHLIAIGQVLGPDVTYRLRAAVDPDSGRPTTLIIEIDQSIDDDASWLRLVDLQEWLLADRPEVNRIRSRRDPFSNVVVVPRRLPRDWNAWLNNIVDEE